MNRSRVMRRVVMVGCGTLIGVLLCACSGPVSTAQSKAPAVSTSQTTTPMVTADVPVCPLPGATNNCLDRPAATMVLAQIQDAQVQAAQLEASEQQYATCFNYAGLYQDLTGNLTPMTVPGWQSCPMTGLTSAEAQQIQGLAIEFS